MSDTTNNTKLAQINDGDLLPEKEYHNSKKHPESKVGKKELDDHENRKKSRKRKKIENVSDEGRCAKKRVRDERFTEKGADIADVSWSCKEVRSKIREFLLHEECDEVEFIKKLDVEEKSYYDFMSYTKVDEGKENSTYLAAFKFLEKQKVSSKSQSKSDQEKWKTELKAINAVELPKCEERLIFDNCNVIRAKINTLLKKTELPKKFFHQLWGIDSDKFRRFLNQSGPKAGSYSEVYPIAYYFFEKKRVYDKKPKSKKRKKQETENEFFGNKYAKQNMINQTDTKLNARKRKKQRT